MDIPSIDLARTRDPKNSEAWLKAQVKEHGDTDPLKLEHRRARLSGLASIANKGVERLQTQKKLLAVEFGEEVKRLTDLIKTLPDGPEKINEIAKLDGLKATADAHANQYQALIENGTMSLGILEALCLIVDSTTIREKAVHTETKKKGNIRVSSASLADENLYVLNKIYRRIKKLYDVVVMQNPLAVIPDTGDDEEAEDETEISDDEIVTDEEREDIKKKSEVE